MKILPLIRVSTRLIPAPGITNDVVSKIPKPSLEVEDIEKVDKKLKMGVMLHTTGLNFIK